MSDNGQKRLMTIEELMDFLNVKKNWVYQHTFTGELPHYKLGALLRFDIEEITEWLKSQRKDQ